MSQGRLIETLTIPMVLTNRNDGQGHHWGRTNSEKKWISHLFVTLGLEREFPFDFKVSLVITRILGKGQRLWDSDSVGRGNAKQLIDSMVDAGWFADDNAKYIRPVYYEQDETQRQNGPAVKIDIYESVK